ncbi:MAG: hypothetical protein IKQ35_04900 [Bacilli bacterium]|nr:hypothetical protein [Bacilli bacterium]
MLKNLGKYDDKKILLEDIFGDKYEGICIHNNIDYNEHEYGVSEESIQLSHIIFYKSIIKDIKIVNDFSNKYGKLEEVVVESGLDLIDEVFEGEEDISIYRLLFCIEDNLSVFKDNKQELMKLLEYLIKYNKNNNIIEETKIIINKINEDTNDRKN